jgi:hypothetical protein
MRWAELVARLGNMTNIFDGRPPRKRLVGRPMRRWKNNIKTDPGDIGSQGVFQLCSTLRHQKGPKIQKGWI